MTILVRGCVLTAALVALSTAAIAQVGGTPQEQAACRPDVRRFCYRIPQNAGSDPFLQCLQAHREHLSARCREVLQSHGV